MARYKCGRCSESYFGLGPFQDHIEAEHDYEHLSAAVNDCEVIDNLGVFEYRGRTVVKCSDCQTIYDAIGAQCPECGSEEVLLEDVP